MPTNVLRNAPRKGQPVTVPGQGQDVGVRDVVVTAGHVSLRARLADTPTAARLWAALPLFSTAERWGDALHFEVPIESGRERGARLAGAIGEIHYWTDDDRILIAFGPTPISRPGEIRLPRPCNVLGRTDDDVTALRAVSPGEKVSIRRVE